MNHSRRRCTSRILMLTASVGMMTQPLTAAPQGRLIDRAVLIVNRGSDEIGREEFTIHQGRPAEAGTGFVGTGFTVTTAAFYPSSRSYASAEYVVQCDSDSQPSRARMDLEGSGQPNVFVDFTARRITVRNRTSAGESAGQYPRSARMLVVDDSLLSVFALLPGTAPGIITLFYPRTGRRGRALLQNLGIEATMLAGNQRQLRHWTLGSEDLLRHLWYDSTGRLMKIEMPSAHLTATRIPAN